MDKEHINPEQTPLPGWKQCFFTIWIGQQLSWIGSSLAQFALVWWITKTTGSATILAIGVLISMLPGVVLGPFVGALVDRLSRRRVMIVADGAVALASLALVLLFWSEAIRIWHVYVIMLVRAIGGTFHWPAMTASTPLMVPRRHLSRVAGLNQAVGGAVNIISPPLGALLLSLLPLHQIMAIDVITAAFAIAPLFFIPIPQPQRTIGAAKSTLWADMREGFRYVWSWPGLLTISLLAMVLNFLINPPMALMPILVTRHLGGEAMSLAWMNSAWGVGLVVGGLALSAWGGFRRRVVTMLMGIVGTGVGVVLVGLTPASFFALAPIGLFFGAVMNALCNGSAFAVLQQVVTPEMQGRVFTLVNSLCGAMTPLSLAVAGPLADAVGVRTLYIVGGAAQVVLGAGAFLVPVIMHIEDNHRTETAAGENAAKTDAVPVGVEIA